MKKLIALSFLVLFLATSTELHQLLRLPVLIHHFFEHHNQDPNKNFADFINEHYTNQQNHSSSEHHDHDNLPFKSTNCAATHISLAFVNAIQFYIPIPTAFCDKIFPIYNGAFYSSAIVSNIWQPPKIS